MTPDRLYVGMSRQVSESLTDDRLIAGYDFTRITVEQFLEAVFVGSANSNLIGIGSIRPGKKQPKPFLHYLTPVSVEDRGSMFIEVVEASKPASTFFCYNAFAPASCAITRAGKKIVWREPGTEVYFSAKKEQVEELCAVVIDLDVGREVGTTNKAGATLTFDEALNIVLERCRENRLPVPSMVVFSGRGLQLVYLLRNETGDEMNDRGEWIIHDNTGPRRPVPRTVQQAQVWTQIADDIVKKRLHDLAPDRKASKTTCNWFRVPGTTNEKSGLEVVAWRVGNEVRYYSLDELSAELLRTAVAADHPLLYREPDDAYRETHSKKRKDDGDGKPQRASGANHVAMPSIIRMKELERINSHRGGMTKGYRHNFVFHYRSAIYRAHYYTRLHEETQQIAWRKVNDIVATFNQPDDDQFTDEDVKAACSANPWQPASNETVADDLDVTAEEVEILKLTSIVPKEIAEERKLDHQNARRLKRLQRDQRDLKVKVLLRADRSYTTIERLTGVKRSTIRNINKAYEATGTLLPPDSPLAEQEEVLVEQIEEMFGVLRSISRRGCSTPA
jgi:hypothetical protein